MKEIKAKDRDIHMYGSRDIDRQLMVRIDGFDLEKSGLKINDKEEFVVMEYQDKYVVFIDFEIGDVMGNNRNANIMIKSSKKMWFEQKPDKEKIALEMV